MVQIAISGDIPFEQQKDPTRDGLIKRKWLLRGGEPDGLNFRLFRSQYQQGDDAFQSPRHHHAFQQFRWSESGAINYAPDRNIPEGDIAYFPRGTFYGPQLKDTGVSWLLQFGFGSELLGGGDALKVHREQIEKMRSRGKIENGVFVDRDPDTGEERRRNPAEVIVEELTGKPYRVPDEGYAEPILMHIDAFEYVAASPGVEIKRMGGFFDQAGPNGDVRVSQLRIAPHGKFTLSPERAQVGWSIGAGMEIAGKSYPELTAFFSERDEKIEITASETIEVVLLEMPRLD